MSCKHTSTKEDTEKKDPDVTVSLVGENLISDFHKGLLLSPTPTFPPTDPI